MCKIAFDDKIDHKYCCNNCIYNYKEAGQVPVFKVYNAIAKLNMMYAGIVEYSDLLFSSKCQRLLARNPLRAQKQ